MQVKLCGFSEEDSLKAAIETNCNFIGFIFYDKSPRNISTIKAKKLFEIVPKHIAKVAVVVDPDHNLLKEIISLKPEYIQFHGNESLEFLQNFKKENPKIKIIKAFRIANKFDLAPAKEFEDIVDLFLFDSKVETGQGGTGAKFDWEILQNIDLKKDWFLSGGININNISKAINIDNVKMLDISSGIESSRGVKSPKLIEQFMRIFS